MAKASLDKTTKTQATADSEFGDALDIQRLWGLRETKLYQLLNAGEITSVLLRRDRKSPRGRRLFSFRSLKAYFEREQKANAKVPRKSDAGLTMVEARQAKKAAGACQ